jgi:transposase-like protein
VARRIFTNEFKVEACRMVTDQGQSIRETARNLGLSEGLLARWVREKRELLLSGAASQSTFESKRIRELEAQVKRLQLEREILKKAMVYFVEVPK